MFGDSVEMSSVTQKDTFATLLLNSSFDEDPKRTWMVQSSIP
jgi:hypothetical protein